MFGLGTQELMLILLLVLIVFGAGKLPQVGSALGKGMRNFKEGVKEGEEKLKTQKGRRSRKTRIPDAGTIRAPEPASSGGLFFFRLYLINKEDRPWRRNSTGRQKTRRSGWRSC